MVEDGSDDDHTGPGGDAAGTNNVAPQDQVDRDQLAHGVPVGTTNGKAQRFSPRFAGASTRSAGWWQSLRRRFGLRSVESEQKVAFVLAGGGSRGAVQVGMLGELVDRGIRPDRVYGASVGAINGAAYAGNPTKEGIAHMEEIWLTVTGDTIFPKGRIDGPWLFFQKRPSIHNNSGVRKIIEDGIDFDNLEDTVIPLEVVATSLTDGRERWFGHGNTVEAILASAAIPSMFPPVIIDDDLLVDGGVVNNVPISRAIDAGCTRIYVLLCGPLSFHPPPPKRPAETALTAFFVAIHARFTRELANLPPGVEVVVFSGGDEEPGFQYRDFSASAARIAEGRAEVAAVLDRYVGTSHDLTNAAL